MDGISLPMVLLTTILTPLAILFSFSITEKVKAYMVLFLLLETGMLGVFMSLDLILFFLFWEVGLIPMYFLINIWGSANRQYASFKFFIYTMAGSVGLLLAIQIIGITLGTFDLVNAIFPVAGAHRHHVTAFRPDVMRTVGLLGLRPGLRHQGARSGRSTPGCPTPTPKRPPAGSMILAGVLLKLGAYGFLRLVLPLYPVEAACFAGGAGVAGGCWPSSLARWLRFGADRLQAPGGLLVHQSHGLRGAGHRRRRLRRAEPFAELRATGIMAANGAVLQMFNHGLSAAAMFLLVGVIYDRTHTRNLNDFGGLFPLAPVYGGTADLHQHGLAGPARPGRLCV